MVDTCRPQCCYRPVLAWEKDVDMLGAVARVISALIAVTLSAQMTAARADPVEQFYRGKTLRIVIGYGVGGGYDLYGRAAAEFLGQFIPGRPTIVPQNMPGGGSFVAAKFLYGAAPKDGSVIGVLSQTLALEAAMQGEKAGLSVLEMPYIGRMTTSVDLGHGLPGAPFSTFEDARRSEIVAGASGGASASNLYPTALNAFAGAKFKIVTGYAGINEIVLAAERGEVQLVTSNGLPIVMARNPDWITKKQIPIIYQASLTRHPLVPHVPTLGELGTTDENKAILRAIASSGDFGRPLSTTPGVPPERLNALRRAFDAMVKDPDFLAKMKERRMAIEPASGEELDRIARETASLPTSLLARIAALTKQ
jgi:tripartite-type tricarboxylate transporter receptor subunit TctC